jgi:hypothetical protein
VRRLVTECERLHSRSDGSSATFNRGYGRGFSVLDVIDTVKRVAGVDTSRSSSHRGGRATRHRSWPPATEFVPRSDGSRACKPSSPTRWHGSASFRNAPADRQPSARSRAQTYQPRGASGNPDDQDKRGDREPSHDRQCCQRRQQRLPQHFDRPWKASTRAGTFEPLLTLLALLTHSRGFSNGREGSR